jgi:hypothetical protein
LNPLQSVAGLGQTGASTVAQAGQNYANQAGQNMIGAGNAQAAAGIAQGNAITGAINQGAGWYMNNHVSSPSSPSPYAYSGGGVGTGAYTDPSSGATYNNPSAYVGP